MVIKNYFFEVNKQNRRSPAVFSTVKVLTVLFFLIIVSSFFLSCSQTRKVEESRTQIALGTVCKITLFNNGQSELYDRLFSRLDEIENVFSRNIESSELSLINASTKPVVVSDEMFYVLQKALYYAEVSGGAFNPAAGPLVSLWSIGTDKERLPSQAEIDALLPLCDYKLVHLDKTTHTVNFEKSGMSLDLGAIVKGYAADEIARLIREQGINSALIDLGGNIYAVGGKQKNSSEIIVTSGEKTGSKNSDGNEVENLSTWRIGIKNPKNTEELIIRLEGKDITVVTSGVYERFYESKKTDLDGGGNKYHHIIDTKTGYPAESGLLSSTIVGFYPSQSSLDADALSTAIFILGEEKGIELLESLGVKGLVITETMEIKATVGLDYDYLR